MMDEPWYKAAFGPLYEDIYGHRNEADARRAVDFVVAHVPDAGQGGGVLDLCCGAGRHSLEWARRTGARPVGLDLSVHLLERARRADAALRLVRGDMRSLPFPDGAFSLVMNLFTSFGYFEDEAQNQLVFHDISRVLRSGGRFVFDHIHPDHLRRHLRAQTTRVTPGGMELRERRRIDDKRRRVEKTIEFVLEGRPHTLRESVRLYEPAEIEALGESVDLRLTAAFGDFDGSPLGPGSPRGLYLFERRERS